MVIYVRLCIDRPGSRDLRMAHRDARQRWLGNPPGRIVEAGPLFVDDAGDAYGGTMMLIEADSREAAMAVHEDDPFTKAGVYDRVVLMRYEKRVG